MNMSQNYTRFTSRVALLLLLTGCQLKPEAYEKNTPKFVFEDFFSGPLCAKGVVKEGNETLIRKFKAAINGYTKDDLVYLDEIFVFDDGEIQTRLWQFSKQEQGYAGSAGDVVGRAHGNTFGDSFNLKYRLAINIDGESWVISMDDWLHLIDENTLMGTTKMSKWGLDVGRIDIYIERVKTTESCGIGNGRR
ncbi:DUF3833 family protein [Aliikangiella sp. G2MR2-5]|uniref:DUF3833 family protein n=1 Tax=Aliikangiella sp. G2MR2-5 TaxID=2788943 RepID=UPI0018A96F36|nr:DUF3833 family protein [Aliikangiella sp. G2MR2-5]